MTPGTAQRKRFDPTRVAHLSGLFAPVTDEVDLVELQVTGVLPADLDGVYLRNGPNPRFGPIGSYLYPLDGDGMVHGVWISQGRARYRNRFVRTPAVVAEERAGRALWGGLESMIMPGPEEVGPALANTFKDLPDINVVRHAGRLLALAEAACPFRLTDDLETVGPETFGGVLPAGMTAHPKIDPVTGEMVVFCYAFEAPFLTWSVIGPTGEVRRGPTPVDGAGEPMMIHDMALTSRYVVLVLAPAFFDLAAAMNGGSMIAWRPEEGCRVALIPRDGSAVRWASDEAFWLWHTVNAYDRQDGAVVLEYAQWPRLTLGGHGDEDGDGHGHEYGHEYENGHVAAAGSGTGAVGGLVRAVVDPVAGTMRRTVLDDTRLEFPRVDDRSLGRRHRRVAMASGSGDAADLLPGEYNSLRFFDTSADDGSVRHTEWRAGNLSVGEAAFAPVPGDPSDERGYWLTFATDRTDATSWLLVIPAQDPASGPVARVRIPVRVPLGLHGAWLPTGE